MRTSSRPRRVGLSLVVGLALVASLLVVGVPSAGALDVTAQYQASVGSITSINVTPYPAASNTASLDIVVTGAKGPDGVLLGTVDTPVSVAVTMCGNYKGDGTPITPAEFAADSALAEPTFCDATPDVGSIRFADAVNGDFTQNPYVLRATGIGAANVRCADSLNGQVNQLPCIVAFGDALTGGATFAGAIPVFGFPPPSNTAITPTPAAGRSDADGPGAGTDGTTVALAGVDYDKSVNAGTAELCDSNGTGCQPLASVSISTDANGALTGSGKVPAGAITGSRKLKVSTASKTASATFVVLTTPTITQTATSGGAGSSITVSGSNFDPAKNLFVSLLDAANNPLSVGTPAPVNTSGTGSFSGVTLVIPAGTLADTYTVIATVNPPDGVNTAYGSFTVSANSCTAANAAVPIGSCSIEQTLQQQVNGGNLSMSQAGGTITMDPISLDGNNKVATGGDLAQVTVIDARGTLSGWTLTGSMADLKTGSGDANHTIPASSVKWTPVCTVVVGNAGELTQGGAGAIPTNAGLCSAVSGGGGGTFTADAAITVDIAASNAAGLYSGKLTLTLTGK